MSEELKPCPFCGSDEIETFYNRSMVDHYTCQYCGASAKNWNSRYESDELPEWVVNKLNDSIVDCGLLEAELKDDNDIEEAVRVGRRANTLRWVLSLRKPEEKE